MRDGLLLLVVALVVLPLAPDRFIGPYGALNPRTICTLTVLLMAVGAVGHVAVRALGPRYGYVVSAIASGFASSTVTVAAMGQMVAKEPEHLRILAAAAIFSNIATVAQVALILGTVEPALLSQMAWPLLAGFATTALYGACLMWHAPDGGGQPNHQGGRRIRPQAGADHGRDPDRHYLLVVADAPSLRPGRRDIDCHPEWLCRCPRVHRLDRGPGHQRPVVPGGASIPVLLAVSCNALSKCVVAGVSGGRHFAVYVIVGQVLLVGAMWLVTWAG